MTADRIFSILKSLYTTQSWEGTGGLYAQLGLNGELAVGRLESHGKFGPCMWDNADTFAIASKLVAVEDGEEIRTLVE